MFKVGDSLACGLLMAFLFRVVILNAPGIRAVEPLSRGVLPIEIVSVIDNSSTRLSALPAPDLNIPMVKESEENLKEQLFKVIKHPLPNLIFIFFLGLIFTTGILPAFSLFNERRRPSRLSLSVSVLRI